MEINFSKLPKIDKTYVCRRQSNRFKWFVFYVYLPVQFRLTENNTTNLG